MRWALNQSINELHCWKMDLGEYYAVLKYKREAQSFRLTAGDKRLFFIERTGFLQSKYLVKSEYNLSVGEVHPGKNLQSGVVFFENKKFHYLLKEDSLELSSKREKYSLNIEVDSTNIINAFELCALLFSTLRVVTRRLIDKQQFQPA